MKLAPALAWTLRAIPVACLSACLGQDDNAAGLTLGITDSPIDGAQALVVQVTAVQLKPTSESVRTITFDPPKSVDLLTLQGGASDLLLENLSVPEGAYSYAQLVLSAAADGVMDSYITLADGSQHELVMPGGTNARVTATYVVPATGGAHYTIDFDARKSVSGPDGLGNYTLTPALRLVDDSKSGSIGGTVDSALIGQGCAPAVYVFTGADVTPDDIDGSAPDPVATGNVTFDGAWHYNVAFLPAGNYTAAFTCDAAIDNPTSSEDLAFVAQNATVVAGQATGADFTAPACCGSACGGPPC